MIAHPYLVQQRFQRKQFLQQPHHLGIGRGARLTASKSLRINSRLRIRCNQSHSSEDYDTWCAMPFVTIDNSNPNFTIMEVEILDYPGIMRVLAWCLDGLDVVAEHAVISTKSVEGSDQPFAHNLFWLCTRSGKKLSDTGAENLAERVRDYLSYCSPKPNEELGTEFRSGPIVVSNSESQDCTTVTVTESGQGNSQLLTIASVLSGLDVQVVKGVIQVCMFRYV